MRCQSPSHDTSVDISVDGLLADMLPALLPESALAALFARRGGRATSEAKRASAGQWSQGRAAAEIGGLTELIWKD